MKNKFFVCIELLFGFIFLFVSGAGAFTWFAIDAFGEDMFVTVLLTIMLVVLPTLLLIYGVWLTCPVIEVNESGITKRLFGLKIKSFNWNEIGFVQFKGDFNPWVFFSKKDLTSTSLTKSRLSKDNIYFFYANRKLQKIQQYAPEHILRQLCL